MIETLRIHDFALVEALDLDFGAGFTVLTGETGAGKSILLQALGLLLGDRASRETVRAGADQARVEGVFAPRGAARDALLRIAEEAGIPWDPGEPLLITRLVGADGRSRAQVNATLVPVAVLDRLGGHLVEVSSQHQHQGLLREETHLDLLDASLGVEGTSTLTGYRRAYRQWREARDAVERLASLDSHARERAEFLRFQAEEIRSAGLRSAEDERLREERQVLAHATKLQEAYAAAERELYSGTDAALDRISRAAREVEGALERDPDAAGIRELLVEAKAATEEAALRLRDRHGALEADPGRLEEVEERLALIQRLERKHGVGVDAVLRKLESLEAELWELDNTELALDEARQAESRAAAELARWGADLRTVRERAARDLESRVGTELEALALGRSSFQVAFEPEGPGPRGTEAVRFLLAANPGEPARALARTASGGELSRVLLALKNALRDGTVETLVFDEVDAGIGGVTADAVAERLAALAETCQVICISHLPQIASRSAHHFRVEKEAIEGRTVTRVRALRSEDRVEELSRMLGGRHVTETTRRHARELVARSAERGGPR